MDANTTTVPATRKPDDASGAEEKAGRDVKKRKPRRREADRIEYNRYRDDALEFAYRFGGGTTRQLAEWILLKHPEDEELRAEGRAKVSPSLRAAYKTIESMKRSKLVKKVAVVRGHLDGFEGRAAREDFFYLSPANGGHAAAWAGSICGVTKARQAREGYRRHQLPSRPEHAAWRTDLLLLLLRSVQEDGVEAPVEEAFGESHPGYPYWVQKPAKDKAGEDLPERKNARAYYDPVIPDGTVSIYGTRFDVEVERWTRTGSASGKGKGVVSKVERHAAYWLRVCERAEEASVREWSADMKAAYGDKRPWKTEVDAYRESLGWLGLADGAAPLVIIMREHEHAVSMRNRVGRAIAEGGLPNFAKLAQKMGRHDLRPGRLVLFAGWDRLVDYGPLDGGFATLASYEKGGGLDDVQLDEAAAYAEHCREPREA